MQTDCDTLQRDLSRAYEWSQKWQLKLNVTKCKVLCISNKKLKSHYCYQINQSPLEWVDTIKYLGVRINGKLKWGGHVADVTAKATKILGLLRQSLYGCSRDAKNKHI